MTSLLNEWSPSSLGNRTCELPGSLDVIELIEWTHSLFPSSLLPSLPFTQLDHPFCLTPLPSIALEVWKSASRSWSHFKDSSLISMSSPDPEQSPRFWTTSWPISPSSFICLSTWYSLFNKTKMLQQLTGLMLTSLIFLHPGPQGPNTEFLSWSSHFLGVWI